jgi:hypothetical protein
MGGVEELRRVLFALLDVEPVLTYGQVAGAASRIVLSPVSEDLVARFYEASVEQGCALPDRSARPQQPDTSLATAENPRAVAVRRWLLHDDPALSQNTVAELVTAEGHFTLPSYVAQVASAMRRTGVVLPARPRSFTPAEAEAKRALFDRMEDEEDAA